MDTFFFSVVGMIVDSAGITARPYLFVLSKIHNTKSLGGWRAPQADMIGVNEL